MAALSILSPGLRAGRYFRAVSACWTGCPARMPGDPGSALARPWLRRHVPDQRRAFGMETGACFTPELQLLLGEEEEISSFRLVIWD